MDWAGFEKYWRSRAEMRACSARRAFNRACGKDIRCALVEIFKSLEND
ncbi:MAG: hypothetical protein ACFFAN_07620 [Promethearchaeota archaeon]